MAINLVPNRELPIMPAHQWRGYIEELELAGEHHLAARAKAQFRRYYGEPRSHADRRLNRGQATG